ncbi:MAG: hypothetical protein R2857_07230 [Vampirovibrionales bacterium]
MPVTSGWGYPTQLLRNARVFPPETPLATPSTYTAASKFLVTLTPPTTCSYASSAACKARPGRITFNIVSNYGYGNNNTISEDQSGADEVFLGSYCGRRTPFSSAAATAPTSLSSEGREAEHTLAPISGGFLVTNNADRCQEPRF